MSGLERGTANDHEGDVSRLASASAWLARPVVHVTALALLALALGIGGVARVPLDGDPAMYATIARTIVETGEWTHLTFNGVPYVNKPPLHFWLTALVFHVAGVSTLTAVLLPGLLGIVCALLVYALARRTFDVFRCPLLKLRIEKNGGWHVRTVKALASRDIPVELLPFFDTALEE